jgi:hypothetical protein
MLSKDYEYSVVKKETDMKTTRPISLLVLLLLLGTWFLPACAAPQAPAMAPEEVITRSEDAMKTVNSYQLKMGIKISVSGVNMDMTIDGAYEAPDRMYMKMNIPLSGEVEIYMKDANTVYAKGSTFGTEWTKIQRFQLRSQSHPISGYRQGFDHGECGKRRRNNLLSYQSDHRIRQTQLYP